MKKRVEKRVNQRVLPKKSIGLDGFAHAGKTVIYYKFCKFAPGTSKMVINNIHGLNSYLNNVLYVVDGQLQQPSAVNINAKTKTIATHSPLHTN